MTITALMDPSEFPTPSDDQIIFDNKLSAYFRNLALRGQQENDIAANLNSIAAGGAYAIPYVYAGPAGAGGKLTFSGATMDTSNFLTLDNVSAGGLTVTGRVASFGTSTSVLKGTLRIEKQGDPTKFLVFNVSGVTASTGYQSVYVTKVESSSSNPFTINDPLMVQFTRTGDKGDTPPVQTPILHVRGEATSGTQSGAGSSTFTGRQLNTVKKNTITGASLASNIISLPVGVYRLTGIAPAGCTGGHQARFNIGGTFYYGSSGVGSGVGTTTHSFVYAEDVQISTVTSVTLEHKVVTPQTSGDLGPAASTGNPEVYAEVIIEKVG